MFGKNFKYKIWDNIVEPDFLYRLDLYTNNEIDWQLNNVANRRPYEKFPSGRSGSHRFWGSTFYHNEDYKNVIRGGRSLFENKTPEHIFEMQEWFIGGYLTEIIKNRDFNITYIGLNGQSLGQDGTAHVDGPTDSHCTLMYFVNHEWGKDWGGAFQLMNEDNTIMDQIDFVPGRFIFFKSNIPHRGLGPLENMVVRKSIVWRGVLNENTNE